MDKRKNILSGFPSPSELYRLYSAKELPAVRKVNGHIHTPWSFSSFSRLQQAFEMAVNEGIEVLGINDFYVTDGYDDFNKFSEESSVFPLFNIEFIGLMKDKQAAGIRINDPNNPGRIYFCGKGLRYPFSLSPESTVEMDKLIGETQDQMRSMIKKLAGITEKCGAPGFPGYEEIKKRYACELVRERHLARAVRVFAEERYPDQADRLNFYTALFGSLKPGFALTDAASLENEIRSKLLKSGGPAFVEENEKSFLGLERIIALINEAGGIPCYPVLLDDASGKHTEFEGDFENLWRELSSKGIGCIELIPGRNDHDNLERFVKFFDAKGFVILFGTEHNTPDLAPLTVSARGGRQLSDYLLSTAWKGAAVIAAHQYLVAKGLEGFTGNDGRAKTHLFTTFVQTGSYVTEHFISTTKK